MSSEVIKKWLDASSIIFACDDFEGARQVSLIIAIIDGRRFGFSFVDDVDLYLGPVDVQEMEWSEGRQRSYKNNPHLIEVAISRPSRVIVTRSTFLIDDRVVTAIDSIAIVSTEGTLTLARDGSINPVSMRLLA